MGDAARVRQILTSLIDAAPYLGGKPATLTG
jgi:hypothetical protein